ncbi:MAG: 6-O-methylguanine DNA methyltransferase [Bdellovibrionales bacterium CG10_big_fil_rev_8_21_14_0_10_45_34]|nr:MAG: 6-O-methylguanine DNA methyltransferase [Bdellovibrionales bacterium CG10_big_fil_rev_8_21_14_0_10_45_34]
MTDYERIEKVIRFLDSNYKAQPSLHELSNVAGLSEFHFQRLFCRWTGATPKSFVQYLTARHAKQLLSESRDILSTSLDSGLSGPSRLHDLIVSIEAVTPGEFKAKGSGVEIRYGFHETPFGKCLLGVTKRGVCHLTFVDLGLADAVSQMKESWPNASFKSAKAETAKVIRQMFKKSSAGKLSLFVRGTPFQIKVWEALLRIPEGSVVSYSHLAKLAGAKGASRAVGSAVGQNAISYLIPCHRVIRETGAFGEYRWGTNRKRAVLIWEQVRNESTQELRSTQE